MTLHSDCNSLPVTPHKEGRNSQVFQLGQPEVEKVALRSCAYIYMVPLLSEILGVSILHKIC